MLRNNLHLASLSRSSGTEFSTNDSTSSNAAAPVRPPRNVPITNDAWRAWIHQVATSASVSDLAAESTLGFCGVCAVQSLEIIKSLVDASFGYVPFLKPPTPTGALFAVEFGNPIDSFKSEHEIESKELQKYFSDTLSEFIKCDLTASEAAKLDMTRKAVVHLSDTILPLYERKIISATGHYAQLYKEIQNNPSGSAALLGYEVQGENEKFAHALALYRHGNGFNVNLKNNFSIEKYNADSSVVYKNTPKDSEIFLKDLYDGRFIQNGLSLTNATLMTYGRRLPEPHVGHSARGAEGGASANRCGL